ncbi:MAG: hypothetical protein WC223_13405 [Bacteroidales bacterium]|jgi:hypothetical protein
MNKFKTTDKVPFTLLYAEESKIILEEPKGKYDDESQMFIGQDVRMQTTWSRTSTTGIFNTDPDEDTDD